ncbi:MAG TPA: hypothetical protein VHA75_01940, partial [Rugosimonospora sp.]|nr:hypothetical protein [Rugosimonospora sp.]
RKEAHCRRPRRTLPVHPINRRSIYPRAQAEAVAAAGGVAVDLAAATGPVFRADSGTLCRDGFHPSADGYRVWAHALYPAVVDALGAAHPS